MRPQDDLKEIQSKIIRVVVRVRTRTSDYPKKPSGYVAGLGFKSKDEKTRIQLGQTIEIKLKQDGNLSRAG